MNRKLSCFAAVFTALFSVNTLSAQLKVDFEIPAFEVQDYNKPYVAIWAESKGQNETLLLWHLTSRDEDKWLPDIRRWWRKAGRYGSDMADGVTGATRGPGQYSVEFDAALPDTYTLFIEVVREDGGRSMLRQAIDTKDGTQQFTLPADSEVGQVTIQVGK